MVYYDFIWCYLIIICIYWQWICLCLSTTQTNSSELHEIRAVKRKLDLYSAPLWQWQTPIWSAQAYYDLLSHSFYAANTPYSTVLLLCNWVGRFSNRCLQQACQPSSGSYRQQKHFRPIRCQWQQPGINFRCCYSCHSSHLPRHMYRTICYLRLTTSYVKPVYGWHYKMMAGVCPSVCLSVACLGIWSPELAGWKPITRVTHELILRSKGQRLRSSGRLLLSQTIMHHTQLSGH